MAPRARLRVSEVPVPVEVVSEPYLVATRLGYAPMITVRLLEGGLEHSFLISAASATEQLEKLRARNSGLMTGLSFEVSKESADQRARYVIKSLANTKTPDHSKGKVRR
jgi:hypothetical protein